MKIKEALNNSRKKLIENKIEDAYIISKVLLLNILKYNVNQLVINEDKEIEEDIKKEYDQNIEKIIKGIPLQYITNHQEFFNLDFYVDENVLIPQPDTEILVEEVIKIVRKTNKTDILDICTGSGCIGISIAKNVKNANITLSDISENALEVARRNITINNLKDRIEVIKSNMFENIKNKYDIIVSNPPYIEEKEISNLSKQVQNEPHIALNGGRDGLDFYRILIKQAKEHLKEDGYLCMEIGYNQKEKIISLIKNERTISEIKEYKDLARK